MTIEFHAQFDEKRPPIDFFKNWYQDAQDKGESYFDQMTLATSSKDGVPNARIVLVKSIESNGIDFYTNYESPKANEMDSNPFAAIVFYWPKLARQVRMNGSVSRLDSNENEAYFRTRPRLSQVGAWASRQSSRIDTRKALEDKVLHVQKEFEGKSIPCPKNWGGYHFDPKRIEFWEDRDGRLHDRIEFVKNSSEQWESFRLAP